MLCVTASFMGSMDYIAVSFVGMMVNAVHRLVPFN